MKLLLYCTKAKPYLRDKHNVYGDYHCFPQQVIAANYLNSKIVAECDYEVEEISPLSNDYYYTEKLGGFTLQYKSCLNANELDDYLKSKNGYAIHIKNLHIFDKPRDLDFYSSNFDYFKKVEKAHQNMMRVWEDKENPRVLISIKSEWLCKILNGEKTIEVRKKVLKEMLKDE